MDEINNEQFTFFWGQSDNWRCFSQWFSCEFTLNNVSFNCAEQAMMFSKARMFHDYEIADKIMKTNSPADHKKLGRKVKGFDKKSWDQIARRLVYIINLAKFTQNPTCLDVLLQTIGTTLVEASPYDKIWGIGLAADNPAALDRSRWLGENWLGEVLTSIRDNITKGNLVNTVCIPF